MYLKSKQKFETDSYKMHSVIKGQCSKSFINKMKGLKAWASVDNASNMLGLLTCIKQEIFSKGREVYCVNAIFDGLSQYLNFKQGDLDNVTYQNKLDSY